MALIMYWGMFGLGEMDSYISFGGWVGRVLMLILAHFWKCYIAQFLFSSSSLWIVLGRQFYYTSQYKISLVFIIPSFISFTSLDNIKHTCAIQSWKQRQRCAEMILFFNHVLHSCWWIDLCCLVYFKVGRQSGKIHQESMKVCDLAHSVTFLWCRNSRGEAFVRSFVSHHPEGFYAPYFFCSKSPGYTSVISLLHSPPSQIEDTVGID